MKSQERGFQKLAKIISYTVLFLSFLCLFAFTIRLALEESKKIGGLSEPLNTFSNFPRTVIYAFKEITNPERFVKADPNLKPINQLNQDVLVLGSSFKEGRWWIYLRNLKTDSIYKSWYLSEKDFIKSARNFSHCSPKTPILLKDSSIVFAAESSYNIYRIDKNSKIIWHDTSHYFHHAINRAADGNIWTCTSDERFLVNRKGDKIRILNDYITKIDVETGFTVYRRSILDLFEKNSLDYLIHGVSNTSRVHGSDVFHLNDIEAVNSDGPFWKKGDIFFSLRNRSLIFLFRPSTDEVLKMIRGPFYHQHDVDVQSDSTITLFDNHASGLEFSSDEEIQPTDSTSLNSYSRVLLYDFSLDTFKVILEKEFDSEALYTPTEGLHEILPNGDIFIESQNVGKVYVLSKEGTKFRNYLHPIKNGIVEPPQWVRVIQD